MNKNKFSVVSLFSGAGGLDCGLKLSGKFETIFANDILASSTNTFFQNFHGNRLKDQPTIDALPAVYTGDIAGLEFNNLEELDVDLVAGGPPCQDFSVIRGPKDERKGIKVSRGNLYLHFVRALAHLQPKFFVFENVPGLKSVNKGKAFETILEDFSNLRSRYSSEIWQLVNNSSKVNPDDYEILYKSIVNASNLGVPQARRRLIIIGVKKKFLCDREKLQKKIENLANGKNGLLHKYPLTPLEVFEGKPLLELKKEYFEIMKAYEAVADEVGTKKAIEWKDKVWNNLTFDIIADYFKINGIQPSDEKEIILAFNEHRELLTELGFLNQNISKLEFEDDSNKIPNEKNTVIDRMKMIPPGENHEFVRGTKWNVEGRGFSLIYKRIHPLKPAYTVVAYGGGGTWGYHYQRDRSKLTNRERARLQTFPDNFVFTGNNSQIRAQIGEAVPPLMMKRIAEVLYKFLGSGPE